MSVIPKIKVGMPKRRERLNLSFDCSTTANIGTVQPTMCREMVPNETFKVKVGTLVRLSALNTPTFGRMSLRHYHTFIPYKEIWEPFECMLSGQHYSNGTTNFTPTSTPYFTMESIVKKIIMNYSIVSAYHQEGGSVYGTIGDPVIFDIADREHTIAEQLLTINQVWDILRTGNHFFGGSGYPSVWNAEGVGGVGDTSCGYLNLGNYGVFSQYSTGDVTFDPENLSPATTNLLPIPGGSSVVTPEGADFITYADGYVFCFKLKPIAKRFRQIMIGLGYQFSPYSGTLPFSPMKLIAYYKAWFEIFAPIRQKSFQDTNCYKLCHWMRNQNGTNMDGQGYWTNFVMDVAKDCYYFLPMDYFSMATTSPQQANSDQDIHIQSLEPNGTQDAGASSRITEASYYATGNLANGPQVGTGHNRTANSPNAWNAMNPLAMKMAMRLLTFCNKNTVIGRSVREWLKAHYGITGDIHSDFNGVVRIGSSRTNVQISDVMATAETQVGDSVMPLGGYAGKGIGYGDSEKFDYTAKEFGCWITLTVVVPESGYYQGYLLENRHLNRYQFFMDEFDAMGYQILERGELIDDYNCDGLDFNPLQGANAGDNGFDRTAGFGFVPRYSEYKVGRNIVNGDLSLVGMYNSMAPYTLDRRLPAGALGNTSLAVKYHYEHDEDDEHIKVYDDYYWRQGVVKPGFMPSVVYDNFRRIDPSDHLGQYNRIFTYGKNDVDHFIIHNVFSVDAWAPMKSLTSSFDTVQEGDKVIDVTHS